MISSMKWCKSYMQSSRINHCIAVLRICYLLGLSHLYTPRNESYDSDILSNECSIDIQIYLGMVWILLDTSPNQSFAMTLESILCHDSGKEAILWKPYPSASSGHCRCLFWLCIVSPTTASIGGHREKCDEIWSLVLQEAWLPLGPQNGIPAEQRLM